MFYRPSTGFERDMIEGRHLYTPGDPNSCGYLSAIIGSILLYILCFLL